MPDINTRITDYSQTITQMVEKGLLDINLSYASIPLISKILSVEESLKAPMETRAL